MSKDKTSLLAPPPQHLGVLVEAAERTGQGLGVATVLGVHPALTLASQVKAPMGVDEAGIAGAFLGRPLEVVKCETIDVEVPADAEMVIEGVTVPGERIEDGPFGEYPGNYITSSNWTHMTGKPYHTAFTVKVMAITMRKEPIFQAMLTGMPMTENHWLKKWAVAAGIYRRTIEVSPYPDDIKGVNLTVGGTAAFHVVVAMHKTSEKMARDIIYTLLATRYMIGLVIVVDEDINIYDPIEVEWAVATRMQPDRDIIILPALTPAPGAPGHALFGYRWGIDATAPLVKDRTWLYGRAVPPGVKEVNYV